MASPERLMAAGIPALLAIELGVNSGSGLLTATGSTIADALVLRAGFNLMGTVASGTGVQLPAAEGQPIQVIYNGGANALLVYPQATEIINAGAAGAAFSIAAGKSCILYPGKNNATTPSIGAWIANLSA